MNVVTMGEFLGKDMHAAVDELRQRIGDGEVRSLGIMVELLGCPRPLILWRGGFKRDPYRTLLVLERAKRGLHGMLDKEPFQETR
jgi:hypothetical protein